MGTRCNIETWYDIKEGPLTGYELAINVTEYHYSPAEKEDRYSPGCEASFDFDDDGISATLELERKNGTVEIFKPHHFNNWRSRAFDDIKDEIYHRVAEELTEDMAASYYDAQDFAYQCKKEDAWTEVL